MISDSVELGETEVCLLHFQTYWNKCMTSKNAQCSSRSGFRILSVSHRSGSWSCPGLRCFCDITRITILFVFTSMMNVWNQSIQVFCHRLWSILWWIVRTFSLTIEYPVVQFLPSFNILEQFENILGTNSPTDFFSSSLKWWSSMHGVDTFVELLSRLVCYLTISLYTFLCMTLHVIRPWRKYEGNGSFSVLLTKILRFERGSVIVHNIFAYFTLSLSAAQVYMIQERCWFSQIDFFVEYFPHRINVLFLSSQFYVIHIHR